MSDAHATTGQLKAIVMAEDRIWSAALIVVGNEILSGRTREENLAYLANWLDGQGIRLLFACVVPDQRNAIANAINTCRFQYDYLFTTGGIGPTHDDITIASISEALALPLVINPVAECALRGHYGDRLTEAHLRLARLPQGAEVIQAADGQAGGIRIQNIIILAGIPLLAQQMLSLFEGKLKGGMPLIARTIGANVIESAVAEILKGVQEAHRDCEICSYPLWRDARSGTNIVLRSTAGESLERCAAALVDRLRSIGVEPVDGGIARFASA